MNKPYTINETEELLRLIMMGHKTGEHPLAQDCAERLNNLLQIPFRKYNEIRDLTLEEATCKQSLQVRQEGERQVQRAMKMGGA